MGMNRRGNMRQQRMAAAGRMMPERMGMGGIRGSNSHYVSKTGHSVHMRGLPFQADSQDVADVRLVHSFIIIMHIALYRLLAGYSLHMQQIHKIYNILL